MNKLQRSKSQASKDFNVTLSAFVKTVLQTEKSDTNLRNNELTKPKLYSLDEKFLRSRSKLSFKSKLSISRKSTNEMKTNKSKHSTENTNKTSNLNSLIKENGKDKVEDNRELGHINEDLKSINIKTSKIPNVLKNLFSTKKVSKVQLASSKSDLSYFITLIMEQQYEILIKVRQYFTIEKLISIISKKLSLFHQEIALYNKTIRLEKHATLESYGIINKSDINMIILKKIHVFGNYLDKKYGISIYTSERVYEIKKIFSNHIKLDPIFMDLKYKGCLLNNKKDVFIYNLNDDCVIDIVNDMMERKSSGLHIPPIEIVETFFANIDAMKTCDCREKRLNAIAFMILSYLNKIPNYKEITLLSEFDDKLHHHSCFKFKFKASPISASKKKHSISDFSSDQISFKDCIYAEIDRAENDKKILIDENDLEFLCNVNSFKEFKHFLKVKIGTKCNLRNVAMLYKYAMSLVIHIGADEVDNPRARTILNYINLYFRRYYENDIMSKGGMGALSIGSDFED